MYVNFNYYFYKCYNRKGVFFVIKITDVTKVQGEELENEGIKFNLFLYYYMLLYIVFMLFA